jgi:hypothetical protein
MSLTWSGDLRPRLRRMLQRPATYTLLAPVLVLAGAATTIVAPMLLAPPAFLSFTLLMAVFQLLCNFDLGLGRLVDRRFSDPEHASHAAAQDVISARFLVALAMLVGTACLVPILGIDYFLAGLAGIAFMLAIGPLAFHRAQSNVFAFTLSAIMVQLGMGLPRLAGLLLGGVFGCIVALAVWYGAIAVVVNAPYVQPLRLSPHRAATLLAVALPLFAFDTYWSIYLQTTRWAASFLDTQTDAGLFAFGANLNWLLCGRRHCPGLLPEAPRAPRPRRVVR